MRADRRCVTVVLLLSAVLASTDAAAAKGPRLTVQDERYLAGLMQEFLFDPPAGARRARVYRPVRSVWGTLDFEPAEGWLVSSEEARVYFTDGDWIPAPDPEDLEIVDFKAACRKTFAHRDADSAPGAQDDPLALAAWLYRFEVQPLRARLPFFGFATGPLPVKPSRVLGLSRQRVTAFWSAT